MPDGTRHVDNVITTKDTGVLMRMKGIDPGNYESLPFDSPFQLDGEGSGAGQLFGATGGVMEAAVRSVYELVTGEKLPKLELDEIRGLDGVKSCELSLGPKAAEHGLPDKIRVAVCNGLGNAKSMIKKLRSGEAEFDFIEVMACPGGCIAGGGMPKGDVQKRLESIYQLDATRKIRRSHENPVAKKFYEDKLLGAYGSERAHELLHVQPVYGGIQNKEESKDK
jgi:iron only hydrogenase large subunit-like protein